MQYSTRRKLRPEDARRSNLALVLQAIYNDPQLSRADIARTTGLTKVTVSDLVAELISGNLVRETGTSEVSRPGKPSTILGFNASGRDILAMDLSAPDQFRGAVLSLKGEPILTRVRPLDGAVGQDALAAARDLAADLKKAAKNPVLGLAVGTPGIDFNVDQVDLAVAHAALGDQRIGKAANRSGRAAQSPSSRS